MGNKAAALMKEPAARSSRPWQPPKTRAPETATSRAAAPQSLAGIPVFSPARAYTSASEQMTTASPVKNGSGSTGFISDEKSSAAPSDSMLVGQADAGPVDAGPMDAGPVDAGPKDAGPVDAGPVDAGPVDAGPVVRNAGTPPVVNAPKVPAPPVIQSKATVHAPDGTADDRKVIGVVETIKFTLDGGQIANWSANNGWPGAAPAKAAYEWAAPETPGTSTITAVIPATGQTATLDMTVIAPNDIHMKKHDEEGFPAGSAGAGMHLTVIAVPRKVNFGWTSLLEVPGPASGVTGFFAAKIAAGMDLSHHPNPAFTRFSFNNTIQFDEAAASGPPVSPPPPWAAGTLTWRIPNRYRAANSTGTGHLFTTTTQSFRIDAAGTVTITKQGEVVRRTP